MIGLLAKASANQEMKIQKSELSDAKWFTKNEVKLMLNNSITRPELGIRTPGPYAIAHHLIKHFAHRPNPSNPLFSFRPQNMSLPLMSGVFGAITTFLYMKYLCRARL
jgi:hypothetical protein